MVSFLAKRAIFIIFAMLLITLAFVIPFLYMAPDEQASPNPPGDVYDMQSDIDGKFPTPVHFATYVLESSNNDVLTRDVLLEFKQNKDRLLDLDSRGELSSGTLDKQPYLFTYYDPSLSTDVVGINSLIDSIELGLNTLGTDLLEASNEDIKFVFSSLIADPNSDGILDLLSTKANSERKIVRGIEIDYWISPAMFFHLLADNEKLGGSGLEIGLGGGADVLNKEHLNRRVRSVMLGDGNTYKVWGVAIDANLESEDEGKAAGVFITFTAIGALLVIGISFRSYWITAISGLGLGMLMIWLKGISALIGLKSGLVIDLVVPIGMISLGVDFVVHAIHRYREELSHGLIPSKALLIGLSGVLGALVLATLSDSIAFLSNLSSNIEAVIHFGSAAAIAVFSSFLILGIVAPLTLMKIDELIEIREVVSGLVLQRILRIIGVIGVASASGASVIMMLAVSKTYGVILLGASAIIFLLVPLLFLLLARKKINRLSSLEDSSTNEPMGFASGVQKTVVLAAINSKVILLVTAFLTLLSVYFALKLEPTFDVKDFFDSDSDFVIGLDKLSEHLADKGGEPGVAYIRGDLMAPESVKAISEFIEKLRDVESVAESPSGEITIGLDVVNTTRLIMESSAMLKAVTNQTGLLIEDSDGDGIPDTRSQMVAVYEFALDHGVLSDDGNILLRPDQVAGAIYYPKNIEKNMEYLTTISFQIPGTRNQSAVTVAGDSVKPLLFELQTQPTIEKTGLTGSPFTREEQLTASTRTLYTSLPIAFVAATLLLIFAMRSVRFAVVTVIPILLVVTWLYGIMYLAGFALNFVTAMIGAISIGVGIDYSIHMTQRFREELRKNTTKISAIASAARGTGVALVASAASSVVGFAIMGFAPMPMFASYGRLTAMMIFFALMSSLLVLPCLLMLVTRQSDLDAENNMAVSDS